MANDEKLAADEARRIAQHESVKGEVREKVHAEITRKADQVTPAERASAEALADSLKRKAVREVAASETELDRSKAFARASQVADYVFYLIYGIIGLEIVLEALGARESAGFKRFVDTMAAPLLAPFQGLMPDPGIGRFRFMVSYVVALVVYVLLHLAVNGLFRLFVQRKTAV
jgi:uncharacterized protein YggT (Ycf19 family)